MAKTIYAIFWSLYGLTAVAGQVDIHTNPDNGLISWRYSDQNFSLQLIQLHPDYVSAFYAARGVSRDLVSHMQQQCVFGTIVRNLANEPLEYTVEEWRYISPGKEAQSVPGKTQWVNQWAGMGSAFQWSILPDHQRFAPSDWSQGFTALPLSHGSVFDFNFSWHLAGEKFEATLKEVRCAQP